MTEEPLPAGGLRVLAALWSSSNTLMANTLVAKTRMHPRAIQEAIDLLWDRKLIQVLTVPGLGDVADKAYYDITTTGLAELMDEYGVISGLMPGQSAHA